VYKLIRTANKIVDTVEENTKSNEVLCQTVDNLTDAFKEHDVRLTAL